MQNVYEEFLSKLPNDLQEGFENFSYLREKPSYLEVIFSKLLGIPLESYESKLGRVKEQLDEFLQLVHDLRKYLNITDTVESEIAYLAEQHKPNEAYKEILEQGIFKHYQLIEMPNARKAITKVIEENASARDVAELLLTICAERLQSLVLQYPWLKQYLEQYDEIRNFFAHPTPITRYFISKTGTSYLEDLGNLVNQIINFTLKFKYILEHIDIRANIEKSLELEGMTNDFQQDYDDCKGYNRDWLSCDQIASIGNAINNDTSITFVPTIDAHLSVGEQGSVERLISSNLQTNSLAAVINLSYNAIDNPGNGNHWVLYFAIREMNGDIRGVILYPMGNHLYDTAIEKIRNTMELQYHTGNQQINVTITHHNLGLQTDTDNCGVWVLWFLSQINILHQDGATLNSSFVDLLPDILRSIEDVNITQVRNTYMNMIDDHIIQSDNQQQLITIAEERQKDGSIQQEISESFQNSDINLFMYAFILEILNNKIDYTNYEV